MSLSPQFLDQLRARTSLSALIGKSVKVTKAGREHKACCPFHNEKTPSFTINDEKGFYHCFGCGAHGDAIRWMTDHQGLPFMDAVKELAAAAGLDVPEPDPRAAKKAEQAKSLHDVMAAAQAFFVNQLATEAGSEARAYLQRRGITAASQKLFGFGFAPDSRSALKNALSAFGEPMLVEAGLLIKPDEGGRDSYDRFRGRLMLPIRDIRGRVIAFGGRILGTGEPKYLNSPDTPLFDKGRTLYNIDHAAPVARKTDRMLVAEGYMDVVALSQAGFADAVAPLGTALTEHQIERLWQMVETPVLCFDGDSAGQKAAIRAATRALPLLRPGHSLCFALLPTGLDPDDLIRERGADAMQALIDNASPLIDLLWQHEVAASPTDTPEQRAGLKARLRVHVRAIGDPDVRANYAHILNERFDAQFFTRSRSTPSGESWRPATTQNRGRGRWVPPTPPPTQEARAVQATGIDPAYIRAVLAGLIQYPAVAKERREAIFALPIEDAGLRHLRDQILETAAREEYVETEGPLTILGSVEMYNKGHGLLTKDILSYSFVRTAGDDDADGPRARSALMEAIDLLVAMPRIEADLLNATQRMRDQMDDESFALQQSIRRARDELAQRIADMAQPGDVV